MFDIKQKFTLLNSLLIALSLFVVVVAATSLWHVYHSAHNKTAMPKIVSSPKNPISNVPPNLKPSTAANKNTDTATNSVTGKPTSKTSPINYSANKTTATNSNSPISTTPNPVTTPPNNTITPPNSGIPVQGPQTLNCAPNPHLCGFPDATNSGVRTGIVLKRVPEDVTSGAGWHYDSRGWIAVDTAGAIFSGYSTNLNVDVTADNITISDNRIIVGGNTFGVSVRHANNVTIQYNEIAGTDTSSGRLLVSIKDIYGDTANMKVIANNLYYVSTAVQVDAGLIQDNYIHDMGFINGDHINGTTSNGGSVLLKIIHNTSFNQFSQTDAISLFEDFGVQANRVIDNNLVAGGGYCIYGGQNAGGPTVSNIQITNNHFARLFYSNCGAFGYIAAWNPAAPGAIWSGNIWDDTGAVVGP